MQTRNSGANTSRVAARRTLLTLVVTVVMVLGFAGAMAAKEALPQDPLVATVSPRDVRDIVLVDAATGRVTNLTKSPLEEMSPCLAGDRVYFSRCTNGKWQTWSCDRSGGTMRMEEAQESAPLQALKGNRLLMFRKFEVGIMDLTSKTWRTLRKVDTFPTSASLSPDETRLVISEDNVKRPAPEAGGISEIRLVDLRTRKVRHLADGNEPRFKPDGSTIVFVDSKGLGLVDVATGKVSRPMRPTGKRPDPWSSHAPVYSRDGRCLAFLESLQSGRTRLVILAADGVHTHDLAGAGELNW